MLTKRERKARATHQKILDEARYGFTIRPMNLIGMDTVAYEAGVGVATVYRHFDAKEGLFSASVEAERIDAETAIGEAVEGAETAADKLRAFVRTRFMHTKRLFRYRKLNKRFIQKIPDAKESFAKFDAFCEALVEEIVRFGGKRGEFASGDTKSLTNGITTNLHGIECIREYENRDSDEILITLLSVTEILLSGLELRGKKR